MKLYAKLNEANLDDDYLNLKSPINKEFFTLEKAVLDINPISNNTFIDATIFLDYNKDTYKRSVYTIMDLFGNVGEVYGLLISC